MLNHLTKNYLGSMKTGLFLLLAMLLATQPAFAANEIRLELGNGAISGQELNVAVGKSLIVYSPKRIKEIIIGDPAVTDVKLMSSQQVLVLGKKAGRTNMAFRDSKKNVIALLDVVVGYDILGIKQKIHEVLPLEGDVEVRSANDSVMLSGQISSALAMDSALTIAKSFAPEDKVLNMMQVGGGQQVMLEVRIAEVEREAAKELGIHTTIGTPGTNHVRLVTGGPIVDDFTTGVGGLGGTLVGIENQFANYLGIRLSALEHNALAKTLAEPNLVALSGQEADFLAGGEFPFQTISGEGNPTTDFKEFGVGLRFTPTVLSNRKINIKLQTEVSSLVQFTGFAFDDAPALRKRRASTTVEMADGQSFAIAGLLQNDMSNAVDQFPGLGDIPILGLLFRSTDFQRNETELVVLITPRLVKPIPSGRHVLPTDGFIPPNETDQYLWGRLEGLPDKPAKEQAAPSSGSTSDKKAPSGIEGSYGHQL